ncbi:MlaA family lipoprotein [Gulbenkiania mobilis]|uniref:MlaA family lipoprotein n=1 Tax=Gulbenkiania mobilis TaxID=397457 RepID=UPI0006BBA4BD|nr:VacJ family lipoprotein [Gulbenkiania mobilis]
MKLASTVLLAAVLATTGCASAPTSPQDPLEPMNRAVYRFNDVADRAVMKPLAQGYRTVTPQPARTAVSNFFGNLRDVQSALNHVLQAEPERALNDVMRVAINSTFGLFGLIDIATPAGLKSYKAGFGDTLARWGWKSSSYLVLPLLGPSTVRDGLGTAVNIVADPTGEAWPTHTSRSVGIGVNAVSVRERLLGVEKTVEEAALDPYSYTRDAYLALRAQQVGTPQLNDGSPTDDLDIDELVPVPTDPATQAVPVDASAAQ